MRKKSKKVVVAGHVCIDITPPIQGDKCSRVEDLLLPGKLIQVGDAVVNLGGTVSNTGLAMKFLGADVTLMGKVGDDDFGKILLDNMRRYGAESGMIIDPKSSTSYTVVIAIPGIDRIFLHNPGANDTFCADDIDYAACEEAALFHFGYPPIMAKTYENDGEQLVQIYRRIQELGCLTSMDMAAVDENSPAGRADWKKVVENTLPYVDFFVPSIEEILFMIDRPHYDELQERANGQDVTTVLDLKRDVAPIGEKLLSLGCKVVILKCGAAGFYYKTAGQEAFDEMEERSGIHFTGFANREGFEKSYVPEAVVSGTGAGDTTIAAFLTAILQGYDFDMCLKLASGTGASCVEGVGALSGLRTFAQLEEKIAAGWKKNE